MTREEKYDLVNSTETVEELISALFELSENGLIQGRTRQFDVVKMAGAIKSFINNPLVPATVATREFGIRQQMIYLRYMK